MAVSTGTSAAGALSLPRTLDVLVVVVIPAGENPSQICFRMSPSSVFLTGRCLKVMLTTPVSDPVLSQELVT